MAEVTCEACGKPYDDASGSCPHCGAVLGDGSAAGNGPRKRPVAAIVVGVIVVVLVVVGGPLAITGWKYFHDVPSSQSHPPGNVSPTSTTPDFGGAPVMPVADFESGPDSDRAAYDNQPMRISGIVVDQKNDAAGKPAQVIAASKSDYDKGAAGGKPAALMVTPPQPTVHVGDSATFSGVYSAKSNELNISSAAPTKP